MRGIVPLRLCFLATLRSILLKSEGNSTQRRQGARTQRIAIPTDKEKARRVAEFLAERTISLRLRTRDLPPRRTGIPTDNEIVRRVADFSCGRGELRWRVCDH